MTYRDGPTRRITWFPAMLVTVGATGSFPGVLSGTLSLVVTTSPSATASNRLAETPEVLVPAAVTVPCVSVGADLHPVDREALGNPGLPVQRNERSAMVGRIRRA